jgi:undecaprenyl-diphosphatase
MLEYSFWEIITMFGSLGFWAGASLTCLILFFTVPKKSRKYFIWFIFLVLPSIIIADSISHGIKFLFQVPRPCFGLEWCPKGFSMPSGHTTVAFAAMTVLGLHYKDRRYLIPFLIFAELVAISRIVLGFHTVPDVLVGSFIGIFVGFLVQKAYNMYHENLEKVVKKV